MPTRYWHPFADMYRVQDHELVLVREAEIRGMVDGFEAALAEVAAA